MFGLTGDHIEAAVRAERSAIYVAAAWEEARRDLGFVRDWLGLPPGASSRTIRRALRRVPECEAVLEGFQRPILCQCPTCSRYGETIVAVAAGLRAARK